MRAARGTFLPGPCYTRSVRRTDLRDARLAMDYHILIVDDEKELCVSLSEILTEEGYPTIYTSDPRETPAILARNARGPHHPGHPHARASAGSTF